MTPETTPQEPTAAVSEPQPPHPMSGDVLPVDVPGRIQLNEYSKDEDRGYAFERDRISKAYREASTSLLYAASEFDEIDGPLRPEVIETMETGLAALSRCAIELELLETPESREGFKAEHETFALSLGDRVDALRSSLKAAQEHRDVIQAQKQRADILEENRELGFPWHRGLKQAGLLTKTDVDTIGESHFEGMDPLGKAMEHVRLSQNEKRLSAPPTFSMLGSIQSSISGISSEGARVRRIAREWGVGQ